MRTLFTALDTDAVFPFVLTWHAAFCTQVPDIFWVLARNAAQHTVPVSPLVMRTYHSTDFTYTVCPIMWTRLAT